MSALSSLKQSIKRFLRRISSPTIRQDRLVRDLQSLGVRPGGILLVHSSLSEIGWVVGGPETVLEALLEAVGPEGTLVMPTQTWALMNSEPRIFDVRKTPSCVGTITERFRKRSGAVRSAHPTHSVAAIGPRALELTRGHEDVTACGPGSPYYRIIEAQGEILFLGAGLETNSTFYGIETEVAVSYLFEPEAQDFTIILENGDQIQRSIHRHKNGITRIFKTNPVEVERFLKRHEALSEGRVGGARSLLLEASPMHRCIRDELKRNSRFLLAAGALS